jgi:hypothetical protein
MAITQMNHLFPGNLQRLRPIIDQHKVVPGPVHFGEFQNHARKL